MTGSVPGPRLNDDRLSAVIHGRAALAALTLTIAVPIAGCGSDTKTVTETVTVGETSAEPTAEEETPRSEVATGSEVAGLGESQTISEGSINVDATVSELENPAKTDTSPSSIQEPGRYWVRVTATLTNNGSKPVEEFGYSFTMIDSKGQEVFGNDVRPVGPAPQLSGTLLPGDKRSGAVLFLVPNDAKPGEIRLTISPSTTPARWSASFPPASQGR